MDKEDLRRAMQAAQEMQSDIVKTHSELAHSFITGQSHDNKVSIKMTAEGKFVEVKVDPYVMVAGIPALEKAILEALQDCSQQAINLMQSRLKQISEKIGL